ncbi:MAG TPA: hypothetical protein VMU00_11205 [Steroidobacteraceae bacterium]|nr:hypothetical protein [Steroidobacteraceae bacterium]
MAPVNSAGGAGSYLDALARAREGIDNGLRSFDATAQAVAEDGTRGQVSAGHAVDALEARNQVSVAARLFQAADQMLGTLLDIRA